VVYKIALRNIYSDVNAMFCFHIQAAQEEEDVVERLNLFLDLLDAYRVCNYIYWLHFVSQQ